VARLLEHELAALTALLQPDRCSWASPSARRPLTARSSSWAWPAPASRQPRGPAAICWSPPTTRTGPTIPRWGGHDPPPMVAP